MEDEPSLRKMYGLASRLGLKVLFMSGYTAEATIQQNLLDERVQFILKPATRDDIARKVREVLDM